MHTHTCMEGHPPARAVPECGVGTSSRTPERAHRPRPPGLGGGTGAAVAAGCGLGSQGGAHGWENRAVRGTCTPFVCRESPSRAFPRPDTERAKPWPPRRVQLLAGVVPASLGSLATRTLHEGSALQKAMHHGCTPGSANWGAPPPDHASCGSPEPALAREHAQCSAGPGSLAPSRVRSAERGRGCQSPRCPQ
jgi:hypothetical protein